jgi:hypothetical protein
MPPSGPPQNDHPLVSELLSEDASSDDVVILWGFNGPAPDGDHTRLYLDVGLSEWVDIPTNEITHNEVPTDRLTPSALWVTRAAIVTYGFRDPQPADFLQGDIVRTALRDMTGLSAERFGVFTGTSANCITTPKTPTIPISWMTFCPIPVPPPPPPPPG